MVNNCYNTFIIAINITTIVIAITIGIIFVDFIVIIIASLLSLLFSFIIVFTYHYFHFAIELMPTKALSILKYTACFDLILIFQYVV